MRWPRVSIGSCPRSTLTVMGKVLMLTLMHAGASSKDGSGQKSPERKPLALFVEAAKRPELRQLFPFTSHDFLCFSRKTAYPFSHDCPIAFCREAGFFIVMAIDQKTILGEG